MLKLLTDLLGRWRSDPSPGWARRSPRQRCEVAYLWLLQSRAICEGSALYGIHLLPGENAGQKKLPALIVHCQTAEPQGSDSAGNPSDLFRCDLQIHLQANYKSKRGAESWDQERAARVLGEVSQMLADVDNVKSILNDVTITARPYNHFHLLRHLEVQSIGLPLGGSIQQDTLALEVWMHCFDYPAAA